MATYGTLTITGPDGVPQVLALDRPEIVIGRDVGSDIRLDDQQASRFHASINCGPEGCVISDLVSSNGTHVNGQRISDPVDISSGATIQIGSYTIMFQPGAAVAGDVPTTSLPHRSAPTVVAGGMERPEAPRRANSVGVIVGTAAVVLLLGGLCCGASYLLGFDVLVSPGLRALSGLMPGLGEPLADFYKELHVDQQAADSLAPTVTPTVTIADTAQPTPEVPGETAETTPEVTEETVLADDNPQPDKPTGDPSITVRNQSNMAFCGIFVRASGESFWGDNRLITGVLPIGDHQLITLPGAGTYDIRLMDCSDPRQTLENKQDVEVNAPYEWEVDNRYTLPPTSTPEPTITPTPEAIPYVSLYADDDEIDDGDCTDINWNTENISAVYFQGDPVVGNDGRTVCPNNTKTYTLRVIYRDGTEHNFTVTVEVN